MAVPKPSFEVTVLDKGFLVIVKRPIMGIEGMSMEASSIVACENVEGVGNALWTFLKPYSNIATVQGALPAVLE